MITDPTLAIERALSAAEIERFLLNAAARWPRLHGAHVSDVLDMLDDGDVLLQATEPVWTDDGPDGAFAIRGELIAKIVWPLDDFAHRIVAHAIRAAVVLSGNFDMRPPTAEVRRIADAAARVAVAST